MTITSDYILFKFDFFTAPRYREALNMINFNLIRPGFIGKKDADTHTDRRTDNEVIL